MSSSALNNIYIECCGMCLDFNMLSFSATIYSKLCVSVEYLLVLCTDASHVHFDWLPLGSKQ